MNTDIIGFAASPRRGGNSETLLRLILEGAEGAGASTRLIRLVDIDFSACIGCEQCRRTKACTGITDGFTPFYDAIDASRGMVLASPAHNYNVTAWMKALIDRMYCYYDFTDDHPRGFSSRLGGQGRVSAFAAVCEQTHDVGMGVTLDMMQAPMEAMGFESVGAVTAELLFHKGLVEKQPGLADEARALGRAMVERINR